MQDFNDWIVDIINNEWRRNPNYTGKFNYNDRGFEIIDNENIVALNVIICGKSKIKMQGYLFVKHAQEVIIGGSKFSTGDALPFDISPRGLYLLHEAIITAKIERVFEYTGENWPHTMRKDYDPCKN